MGGEGVRQFVLAGCGSVDPSSVDAYVTIGGYSALERVLSDYKPEDVISHVETAGLLGRGGAGYPVARKWRAVREAPAGRKFVVANAYDADPLAPIGRTLLERMPHRVLEGMLIAAYAVGAWEGIVYCRGENSDALRKMRQAIAQAESRQLLGPNSLGPGRDFDVRVAPGWAGFIGGEETAALAAIEGRRGMPAQRPPWPAQCGLWGLPTVVNSAETLALVPALMMEPAVGTGTSRAAGTKVFSIQGSVQRAGIAELPLGATLREIIDHAGGMSPSSRALKAAQIGGPTGACLPASALDMPLSYESLREAGAHLGSGRVEVLDDSTCMVGFAREAMSYLQSEACGRCVPCRLGTKRIAGILEAATSGLGEGKDIEILEELSANIAASSICGFGITAPGVVTSTLRHFREEYTSHVEKKRCPTGQCGQSRQFRYRRRAVL